MSQPTIAGTKTAQLTKDRQPTAKNQQLSIFDRDRENPTLNLPIQSSQTHRIISLFSGCGGMDLGFLVART
jgi:hypothetical protein